MPSTEENKLENLNSKSRQGASRSRRRAERGRKDALKSALQGASSASERREIKMQFPKPYKTPKPETSTDDLVGYNGTVSSTGGDTGGSGGGGGGGGGGGDTITLDVVLSDNTAGQAEVTGVIL